MIALRRSVPAGSGVVDQGSVAWTHLYLDSNLLLYTPC